MELQSHEELEDVLTLLAALIPKLNLESYVFILIYKGVVNG